MSKNFFQIDLLRSALEINHAKSSSQSLRKNDQQLSDASINIGSAPKLHKTPSIVNISQPNVFEAFSQVCVT